jgi:ClpP class serine protease
MKGIVQFLKRLAQTLFILVIVVFFGSILLGVGSLVIALRSPDQSVTKPSILALDLDGVIVDTREIVENLRKYRKEDRIKGVLLRASTRPAVWSDRVTGSQAVKWGFADSIGTWDDARRTLGQMAGLGDDPQAFKVKKRSKLLGFLEETLSSETSKFSAVLGQVLQTELSARPLLLLPGAIHF